MRADLFSHQDEREAEADLEAAREARAQAGRKYRCAPHGEVQKRAAGLREATAELLRAELHLARIRGQTH